MIFSRVLFILKCDKFNILGIHLFLTSRLMQRDSVNFSKYIYFCDHCFFRMFCFVLKFHIATSYVSGDYWNVFFRITKRSVERLESKEDQMFNTLQFKTKFSLGLRNTVMKHGLKQSGFITH